MQPQVHQMTIIIINSHFARGFASWPWRFWGRIRRLPSRRVQGILYEGGGTFVEVLEGVGAVAGVEVDSNAG